MGQDLGLSDLEVEQNFIFTHDDDGVPTKVGSLMTIAMDKKYGKEAFGLPVPDLTLVARSRGSNWIYTYLRSFYLDENQPMGVNNLLIPNVAMPHALWELQGWQKPVYRIETDEHNQPREVIEKLELVEQGELTPAEYDQAVRDITNFLTYVSEPALLVRKTVGVWVVLFLLIITGIAYMLKKEYWKDIK
jgi:ubiquinol-cytochrome c reductase cytochrome c1 subunit